MSFMTGVRKPCDTMAPHPRLGDESTTAHGYQQDKCEQLYRAVELWLRPPFPNGEKELPARVERVEDLRCGLPEKNLTVRDVYAEWLRGLPRRNEPLDPAALRAFLRQRLRWSRPLPNIKADVPGLLERLDIPHLRELWPGGRVSVRKR